MGMPIQTLIQIGQTNLICAEGRAIILCRRTEVSDDKGCIFARRGGRGSAESVDLGKRQ